MKKNMSVNEAIEAIRTNEGKSAEILASLTVVKIRRFVSYMGLALPKGHSKLRKAGLIAAVVEAMNEKGGSDMESISLALEYCECNGGRLRNLMELIVRLTTARDELIQEELEFYDTERTKDEETLFFVEMLKKRIAMTGADVPAAMAILNAAAEEVIACQKERCEHNWNIDSGDAKYYEEQAAWENAKTEMNRLFKAVQNGVNIVEAARLDALASKISAVEVEGYTVSANPWKKYGKTRIYVSVYDMDGKEQPESPYLDLDKGDVFWKTTPKTLPVWAEAVIAAMKAAI